MTNKEHISNNMRTPTYKRYKNIFFRKQRISILRCLQYEMLKEKILNGKVLDFGGGKNADYHNIITCEVYDSINIDKTMDPTWITNIGENLPCPHDHYDTVLSMNTIEHIYDAHFVIKEIHKALKKNGEFICSLPFLYPIHAHPNDYFRPTIFWWNQTLLDIGFKDIKITPLLWGHLSTGLVCSGIPGPFRELRIHLALILDMIYVHLRRLLKKGYDEHTTNYALGYFIEARKI